VWPQISGFLNHEVTLHRTSAKTGFFSTQTELSHGCMKTKDSVIKVVYTIQCPLFRLHCIVVPGGVRWHSPEPPRSSFCTHWFRCAYYLIVVVVTPKRRASSVHVPVRVSPAFIYTHTYTHVYATPIATNMLKPPPECRTCAPFQPTELNFS